MEAYAKTLPKVSCVKVIPKKKSMLFKNAKKLDAVLEAIQRPYETKPWYKYRAIFITDKRIQGGATFWNKYRKIIKEAEHV